MIRRRTASSDVHADADANPDEFTEMRAAVEAKWGVEVERVSRAPKDIDSWFVNVRKTEAGRTCPFTGRVHKSNTMYFIYNAATNELQHRCHDADCVKRAESYELDGEKEIDVADEEMEAADEEMRSMSLDSDWNADSRERRPSRFDKHHLAELAALHSHSVQTFTDAARRYINQCFAFLTHEGKALVVERMPHATNRVEYFERTVGDFLAVFGNLSFIIMEKKKTPKGEKDVPINVTPMRDWLDWFDRREYDRRVFDPRPADDIHISASAHMDMDMDAGAKPEACGSEHRQINLYTGPAIRADDARVFVAARTAPASAASADGDGDGDDDAMAERQLSEQYVGPLLTHVRDEWCQGNIAAYEYTINWMAHLVQRPWRRTNVALVIKGGEGSGKGIVVQKLGAILGRNFKDMTRQGMATARFNGYYMEDALLCFVDENCWGGDRATLGNLKTLITEPQRVTEKKCMPVLMVDNYCNLIFASNEDWVVPQGPGSRRWMVLETKNTHAGRQTTASRAYYERIAAVDPRAFAHYLYERDISTFHPEMPPMTKAAQSQILRTMCTVGQWWAHCLSSGVCAISPAPREHLDEVWGDVWSDVGSSSSSSLAAGAGAGTSEAINKDELYQSYKRFLEGTPHKPVDAGQFWKELAGRGKTPIVQFDDAPRQHGGKRRVRFPSLRECRCQFKTYVCNDMWDF